MIMTITSGSIFSLCCRIFIDRKLTIDFLKFNYCGYVHNLYIFFYLHNNDFSNFLSAQ